MQFEHGCKVNNFLGIANRQSELLFRGCQQVHWVWTEDVSDQTCRHILLGVGRFSEYALEFALQHHIHTGMCPQVPPFSGAFYSCCIGQKCIGWGNQHLPQNAVNNFTACWNCTYLKHYAHLLSATVRVYSLIAPCCLPDLTSLALLGSVSGQRRLSMGPLPGYKTVSKWRLQLQDSTPLPLLSQRFCTILLTSASLGCYLLFTLMPDCPLAPLGQVWQQ